MLINNKLSFNDEVCNFTYNTPSVCNDTFNYTKFVGPDHQYPCPATDNKTGCCQGLSGNTEKQTGHLLDEARKSFMSGHSSVSFYCATFLVIYLHARLSNDQFKDARVVKKQHACGPYLLDSRIPRCLLRYNLAFKLLICMNYFIFQS